MEYDLSIWWSAILNDDLLETRKQFNKTVFVIAAFIGVVCGLGLHVWLRLGM